MPLPSSAPAGSAFRGREEWATLSVRRPGTWFNHPDQPERSLRLDSLRSLGSALADPALATRRGEPCRSPRAPQQETRFAVAKSGPLSALATLRHVEGSECRSPRAPPPQRDVHGELSCGGRGCSAAGKRETSRKRAAITKPKRAACAAAGKHAWLRRNEAGVATSSGRTSRLRCSREGRGCSSDGPLRGFPALRSKRAKSCDRNAQGAQNFIYERIVQDFLKGMLALSARDVIVLLGSPAAISRKRVSCWASSGGAAFAAPRAPEMS